MILFTNIWRYDKIENLEIMNLRDELLLFDELVFFFFIFNYRFILL